jgi:hypothetical protein
MKRIKEIIKAYIITRRSPSQSIREAWTTIKRAAPQGPQIDNAINAIGDLVEALVAESEEMEKAAKAESEAAK